MSEPANHATPSPSGARASAPGDFPASLGPFALSGVLGSGGSAVVYATTFGDADAALKVPHGDRELSAKEQDRFLEEARMLSRVQHEAVVEVLDSGKLPDGRPYLLMRRYQGETLADRLARSGPVPLELALALFEQLADATSTLHAAGLLHRDIKPENVFLVSDGRGLKLLDLGIAKDRDAPASTTTQAGVARGTPATMAPERFFGAAASEATDVYELAVVFYAMLVGGLPWPDTPNVEARLNPRSPAAAGVDVPEALAAVLMRALSTRPERRPRSVDEFRTRVRSAISGSAASVGRVTADTQVDTDNDPPVSGPLSAPASRSASSDPHVLTGTLGPRGSRRWLGVLGGLAVVSTLATVVFVMTRQSPSNSLQNQETSVPSVDPERQPRPLAPPEQASPRQSPSIAPAKAAAPKTKLVTTKPAKPRPPASNAAPNPSAETQPKPKGGSPRGAPCTRSSECASMVCAAETCQ